MKLGILFDRRHYLASNPDVAASGSDPLFHFLRTGAAEGRNPNPVFDLDYYRRAYPDVVRAGYNPLLHFARFGASEGRNPHPEFDTAYYVLCNSSVLKGENPLAHFLRCGAAQRRLPNPDFDPDCYLECHPDVAAEGMEPLLHFALHGAAEGRLTHRRRTLGASPEAFLPSTKRWETAPDPEIDIVIPAYRGFAETKACLDSVLATLGSTRARVIVVNDASPEPDLVSFLRNLAREGLVTLIENSRNLGFVRSVNAGMSASRRDVILLNSDTVVFGDWIRRICACAHSDPRIGSVTPFSNNATICSYPRLCANNSMTAGFAADLDRVFAETNRGRLVRIPTGVGFCMFIRRDCLDQTGLLDAASFGAGYGEENDFCRRAEALGWTHALCCDVFVYHAGGVSFGQAADRQRAAMRILAEKHPTYSWLIDRHVRSDPANAFRIAVTASRIRAGGKRVFLAVLHSLGGGVVQHARDIADSTAGDVLWLTLKPQPGARATLACQDPAYSFEVTLQAPDEFEHLAAALKACGVERIHIHHLMKHEFDIARLSRELRVPFDFTIHDYYSICPQVNLSDPDGRYCGEPDARGCDRCIEQRGAGSVFDIASWRARHAWASRGADRVIAPSRDAAARIARYFPEAKILAASHSGGPARAVTPRKLGTGDRLRIATLGVLAVHKGFHPFEECARSARRLGLPLEFVLIGSVESGVARGPLPFRETGPYDLKDLPALVERESPDLVWFPARWPETFSYTLSACLELGLPVAVPDLGAFPERVGGRAWSWILPWDSSPRQWTEFFLQIRDQHFVAGVSPPPPSERPCARQQYYPQDYLRVPPADGRPAAGPAGSPSAVRVSALVASAPGGQIQACGYVRIVQPLTHPRVADLIHLTVTRSSDESLSDADAVVVQRVELDLSGARRIAGDCSRRGARLILEFDDDLFQIPPQHPEYALYSEAAVAARWLAAKADAIVTSTEALRASMLEFNSNTVVIPNYLDDRLWTPALESAQPDSGKVRFLYFGTPSHVQDLEFLEEAIALVPPRIRDKMLVEVAGVARGKTVSDRFKVVGIPAPAASSYPRFVAWLKHQNRWHWGLAPLLDTPFNRSKSPIKFLEYAALGLPGICSDMNVYRDAPGIARAGLLVPNRPEAWSEALERAVADRDMWNRLRNQTRSVAEENTVAANAERIKCSWRSIAQGPPASVSAARG